MNIHVLLLCYSGEVGNDRSKMCLTVLEDRYVGLTHDCWMYSRLQEQVCVLLSVQYMYFMMRDCEIFLVTINMPAQQMEYVRFIFYASNTVAVYCTCVSFLYTFARVPLSVNRHACKTGCLVSSCLDIPSFPNTNVLFCTLETSGECYTCSHSLVVKLMLINYVNLHLLVSLG